MFSKALAEIISKLIIMKEEGNKHFQEGHYSKAVSVYKQALEFAHQERNSLDMYEEILNNQNRLEYHRIMAIIYSNNALVSIKLANYPQSLMMVVKSRKQLTIIKELLNDDKVYQEQFGILESKLKYRALQAWENLPIIFSRYSYSREIVDGLQLGTLLSHNDADSHLRPGIFSHSQVLMTDFNRESSKIQGLIINKPIQNKNGRQIWIGGPCEFNHITTLHNIPQAPGARKIIEGVYCDGDISQWKDDSNYTIKQFQGYASWFTGQLEGEIKNAHGWLYTNEITANQIFNPIEIFEMNLN
eukprot:TRINITY_DN2689_c0_g1_i1.p1 TRINITY_DN2689_c0_g1~~TRINITY_DN2689_c0_g1_i1.p1  ORF type:complete len:301 (+),score=32.01 TRINITY_DN2689_c0_g1_i1:379-1281(+)